MELRLVIYAIHLQPMIDFYRKAFGLELREADDDYGALVAGSCELVLLQAPKAIAKTVEITQLSQARGSTPIKLVFFINEELAALRSRINACGGSFNSAAQEWRFNRFTVCDGWDVEGNIFQVRRANGDDSRGDRADAQPSVAA
ncbi:MAG: hypothetical protein F6K04_07265 [Leptolyngbya sp. SIO4C5]|nr:hypothetical protein [Leptolyngbya sp. SIO4C5]